MNQIMKLKKRKGFTLIELIIVVAIIGVLLLMILPQFNNVTKDSKIKVFEANCQTAISAYAMYMAAHNGDRPTEGAHLDPYINGGFASMAGKPTGATYTINAEGVFTGTYRDEDNKPHTVVYPQAASSSAGGGG